MANEEKREHKIVLENRDLLSMTGVLKVESSVDERVCLVTAMGDMVVEGEELFIRHLDLERGELFIGGHIDRLTYPAAPLRGRTGTKGVRLRERVFK